MFKSPRRTEHVGCCAGRGWVDVDVSQKGAEEAVNAGRLQQLRGCPDFAARPGTARHCPGGLVQFLGSRKEWMKCHKSSMGACLTTWSIAITQEPLFSEFLGGTDQNQNGNMG